MSIREKQQALYGRWEQQSGYARFVYDGILNYNSWNAVCPKVMFLLKETADDYTNIADRPVNITKGNGTHFWWNICYWKYLITAFYFNQDPVFISADALPEVRLNNNILDSIAYVNIKKQCDNLTKSNDADILRYAHRDADLLKEQIDLINPDVVFCSNATFKAYEFIYSTEIERINHICFRHKNRLLLNFAHPSYFQIRGGREALFNKLKGALLENGNVTRQFSWNN